MKQNIVSEFTRLMVNNPNELIRQAIESFAQEIDSEEVEKNYILTVFDGYKDAMRMANYFEEGSPIYHSYQTLVASAFDGRDDIFHRTYEKLKERANEMYELSLKDFDLAKKMFLSFCSATPKKKRFFRRKHVQPMLACSTEPLVCTHTFNGVSMINASGLCPICGEWVIVQNKEVE